MEDESNKHCIRHTYYNCGFGVNRSDYEKTLAIDFWIVCSTGEVINLIEKGKEEMTISENIKKHREMCGLTQLELAARLNISGPFVCQLERGTKVPTLPLAVEIAKALGCKVTDFLE